MREGGLVTYKQQISFGVHVLAMMAAFYAFGHVAGMAITGNKAAVSLLGPCLRRCCGWMHSGHWYRGQHTQGDLLACMALPQQRLKSLNAPL